MQNNRYDFLKHEKLWVETQISIKYFLAECARKERVSIASLPWVKHHWENQRGNVRLADWIGRTQHPKAQGPTRYIYEQGYELVKYHLSSSMLEFMKIYINLNEFGLNSTILTDLYQSILTFLQYENSRF